MTSDNQPLASGSSSNTAAPPIASSSSSTSAPVHAPAHPAFHPPGNSSSSAQQNIPLPTTSEEVITLITNIAEPFQIFQGLVPTLQDVANGKPWEGAKLKEKERQQMGEQTLSCGESNEVYNIEDSSVTSMTAGLTYLVSARLDILQSSSKAYYAELLTFTVRLCSLGQVEQFSMIPSRVIKLAWGLLRLAQHLKKVSLAIPALRSLITKSCRIGNFSGVYAAYLEACLIAKNFEAGNFVLDQVFLGVNGPGINYLDILTYHHHAGLVSAALKNYGKAKQYFLTVVSLPTATLSAIQLACAKRAILCELLETGKRISFPRYTASTVTRAIDKNASVYIDLAKGYESSNWSGVREIASKSDFSHDCNSGLIEQVLKSITKRRILQLKEVYSRMTINDLVARVGPSSRETVETVTAILGEMITTGRINASILPGSTPATSIVTFSEDKPIGSDQNSISSNSLAQANYLAAKLENELTAMSKHLGISKEYLKKQANILELGSGKGGGSSGPGGGKGRIDEFDQLMAAEEFGGGLAYGGAGGGGGGGIRGVGGNYGDMGF
ncbi:uncharacterized protein L201_002383 [Kwoniella dendrophila CBS 6074]|uniref:COP9 signalosome complex subunit 3 n=1 Tax=Kwoniella dendrophila CBS 6074 TaxID=1295534 RepID=A0AAX4JSR0_9TREE